MEHVGGGQGEHQPKDQDNQQQQEHSTVGTFALQAWHRSSMSSARDRRGAGNKRASTAPALGQVDAMLGGARLEAMEILQHQRAGLLKGGAVGCLEPQQV